MEGMFLTTLREEAQTLTLACLPISPEGETLPALAHTGVLRVHEVLFAPVGSVSTVINSCKIYFSRAN